MLHLSNTIDFELAKLLNNRIYADMRDDRYAAEDVIVSWDNYSGSKKYKEGEFIEGCYPIYIHGKNYYAPTYAEVIDWLFDKGIIIEFTPCVSQALEGNIAYYYQVWKMTDDKGAAKVILRTEDITLIKSFQLTMKEIITKLIEMNLI